MGIFAFKKIGFHFCLSLSFFILIGCGGSGGGNGQTSSAAPSQQSSSAQQSSVLQQSSFSGASSSSISINAAPIASISFPPANAYTQGNSVLVRGNAHDDGVINNLTVNGKVAFTDNNFSTWSVEVPLEPGSNLLSVVVTDDLGITNKEVIETKIIHQSAQYRQPVKMVVDEEERRAFVLDYSSNNEVSPALIAIDLDTGVSTLISDNYKHPSEVDFNFFISDMTFDAKRKRILILRSNEIIEVDIETGSRSIFEIQNFPDSSSLSSLRAITFDESNDILWIATNEDLVSVDAETGVPTIVADTVLANGTLEFTYPITIGFDSFNSRVVVAASVDEHRALIGIDASTGDRIVLSDRSTPNAENLFRLSSGAGLAVDEMNGRIWLADRTQNVIYEIDSITGKRKLLVNPSVDQAISKYPQDIFYDGSMNRMIILDSRVGSLVSFDMESQSASLIAETHTNGLDHILVNPEYIVYHAEEDKIILQSDTREGPSFMKLDPESGERSPLLQGQWDNSYGYKGVALDEANDILYINSGSNSAIEAINLITWEKKTVSGVGTPDYVNMPRNYSTIELDSTSKQLIAIDTGAAAIHLIDLASGKRKLLSDNSVYSPDGPMKYPITLDIDKDNNRLFVVDFNLDSIFQIDMTTGKRQLITGPEWPDTVNALGAPRSVAYDSDKNRLIVVDSVLKAIVAVDIETGSRTIISDNNHPDSTHLLSTPTDIKLGADKKLAYVVDRGAGAFISVDLTSGLRSKIFNVPSPEQFVMDTNHDRVFITQSSPGALYEYNFAKQQLTEITIDVDYNPLVAMDIDEKTGLIFAVDEDYDIVSMNLFGEQIQSIDVTSSLYSPEGIVLSSTNEVAYILDNNKIREVQLGSGESDTLFSAEYGSDFQYVSFWDIDMAELLNSLVMVGRDSEDRSSIFKLDLETSNLTTLSNNADTLQGAAKLAVDQYNNRALVYDHELDSIVSVNLDDGQATILSGPQIPNEFNPIFDVSDMAIDTKRNRLIVSQHYIPGLLVIDMETGERVYISR